MEMLLGSFEDGHIFLQIYFEILLAKYLQFCSDLSFREMHGLYPPERISDQGTYQKGWMWITSIHRTYLKSVIISIYMIVCKMPLKAEHALN